MNKTILMGRLTKDPEIRYSQGQQPMCIARYTLAVNRRPARDGKQETDFINIVAWRQTAEFVTRYFKKGKPILVCGSIQSRSYTDGQGNKRYITEVVADEVGFVESKAESTGGASQYTPDAYTTPSYSNTDAIAPKFEAVSEEDDLPF